jgi:hypothetical protein
MTTAYASGTHILTARRRISARDVSGAAAFADDVPHRDLPLSPDHAIYIDDVLIPIRHLINGVTIIQHPTDVVLCWHVDLARLAVIFAESLPHGSDPDIAGRTAFENGAKVMHPRSPWSSGARRSVP